MVENRKFIHDKKNRLLDLLAGTTGCLDLCFGARCEVLSTDNERDLWKFVTASDLEEAGLGDIDHWSCLASLLRRGLIPNLRRDKSPQLIDIDGWIPLTARKEVKMPHAHLSEVSGVIAIKPGPLMVHTTGVTVATRRLPVLSNTAISHGLVTAEFPALLEARWHSERPTAPALFIEKVAKTGYGRLRTFSDNGKTPRTTPAH